MTCTCGHDLNRHTIVGCIARLDGTEHGPLCPCVCFISKPQPQPTRAAGEEGRQGMTREQLQRDAAGLVKTLMALALSSPDNEPKAFKRYLERARDQADALAAALAAPPPDETRAVVPCVGCPDQDRCLSYARCIKAAQAPPPDPPGLKQEADRLELAQPRHVRL